MRILGVDPGTRRTGLALSDPLGVTCSPFGIVAERDRALAVQTIVDKAGEQDVGMIVVGLPRPLSGGTNAQVAQVQAFVEQLRAATHVPVTTWDERFTSKMARQGRRNDGPPDAVAACYMLQNYLDRHSDSTKDGSS